MDFLVNTNVKEYESTARWKSSAGQGMGRGRGASTPSPGTAPPDLPVFIAQKCSEPHPFGFY